MWSSGRPRLGGDAFTDSSLNRLRFFCQLLILLLFFNIAGEESGEACVLIPVFIQDGASTENLVITRE